MVQCFASVHPGSTIVYCEVDLGGSRGFDSRILWANFPSAPVTHISDRVVGSLPATCMKSRSAPVRCRLANCINLLAGIALLGGCATSYEQDRPAPVLSSVVPVIARPIATLAGNLRLRSGHLTGRDDIRAVLQRELRPLDIVLLSAPYKGTSLFIPGHFSHAGIWLGELGDWEGVEIAPHLRSALVNRNAFFHADRDGVRFSDIDEILDADHAVIARLSKNVRSVDVADKINSMSVRSYDFNFDGADRSKLLCTELVLDFFEMTPVATTRILGRSFVTPDQLSQTLLVNGAYRFTIADD